MNQKEKGKRRRNRVLAAVFAGCCLILLMTGCQSSKSIVTTDGSTSMEKLVGMLGEAYEMRNTSAQVNYNPTGSTSGIQSVEENRSDIGLSSRYLKEEEKENGLEEIPVAIDAIGIVVNKENPVKDLTKEQIQKIYSGEITNWKEVGGDDSEIVLIGREAGSGTRDGFEEVLDLKNRCPYRQELTSSGEIMTSVSSNPNAIGYISLGSLNDNVSVLSVDGIMPDKETIQNGSYAIWRPLMFVVSDDVPLSKEAQKFMDFCKSDEAVQYIEKAGMFDAE